MALAIDGHAQAQLTGVPSLFDPRADVAGDQQQHRGGEGSKARYRPPTGINGYAWETPLRAFFGLAQEPLHVQTAYSPGKVTRLEMQCVPNPQGGCDLEKSLRTLDQHVEGQGFHLLAEYYVESQGLRFKDSGALLYPVLYQFCASWGGVTGAIPNEIQDRMKLCGARLLFQSHTLGELQKVGGEPLSNYDLVFQGLIQLHGHPDGYERRGRVTIEADDKTIAAPRMRRFEQRRWCGPHGMSREIAPRCSASIVLAFDPTSGWGVVLYATRPVWAFAYARHQGGVADDPLYALLHDVNRNHPATPICTGTHLCRPEPPRRLTEERRALFKLSSGATQEWGSAQQSSSRKEK